MLAVIDGQLGKTRIEWSRDPCVGVVMASGGYPGKYPTGLTITGLDRMDKDVMVFHAGTALKGGVVTSGGRVLTVAANGRSIAEARSKIYANMARIEFEGSHYRKDIAAREVT
jgi:phosphoribosylamine--glycine ligase